MIKIISYIHFLFHSKNKHGVHSPFVYNLVTKCFCDNTKYTEYDNLKSYRTLLLKNKKTINVTDFGAGSKVFTSNERKISKIAKTAGITSKNAELLFRIVRFFKPKTILELGTSLGLATNAMALGNSDAIITTLEGCKNTQEIAKMNFERQFEGANGRYFNHPKPNVNFNISKFEDYFKTFDLKSTTYNLIYFDGNHSIEATLAYFDALLPTVTNDSVWIFDDIHWSKDMEKAWQTIKNHPKVTVTIDTFQWGIVFFRTEQEKEHFVIRI